MWRPAILSGFIIGPKVNLVEHFAPHGYKSQSGVTKGFYSGSGKIHKINSLFTSISQRINGFFLRRLKNGARANAYHADPIFRFGMNSVFHSKLLYAAGGYPDLNLARF